MKVVVQNGCEHVLSRNDVETAIQDINSKYFNNINQITLYQGDGEKTYIKYYKKSKILGLFSSKESNESKTDVVNELLVALACIYDIDDYPQKELPIKYKEHYLMEIRE